MGTDSDDNALKTHLAAEGLLLCIPEELDFTFQIIEGYDTQEPILARWEGDELSYLLTFEKLPPGWLDAKKWLKGFKRTIKFTSKLFSFKTIAEGDFEAKLSDFRGKYSEYEYIPRGDTDSCRQLVYFIANKESSYVANATLISEEAKNKNIIAEMNKVMESVVPTEKVVSIRTHEKVSSFIGIWRTIYQNENGESIDVLLSLEQGGIFKFREKEERTESISPYTGSWYEANGKPFCVFIFTKPRSDSFRDYSDEAFGLDEDGQLVMEASDRGGQLVFVQLTE